MAVLPCRTCRRSIDVSPVKCPYCGVVQPNQVKPPAPRAAQLAALLFAGLGVGLSTATRTAPRPAPRLVSPFQAAADRSPNTLEAAARQRAHGLGPNRLVDVEDLFLTPAKLSGEKVAVPGVIVEAKFLPGVSYIEVGSQWSSQARITVDVGKLNPEYLKTLVKRQDAYHVFLVKGEVVPGDLAPGGRGWHVRAQEIEGLGETTDLDGPARAAKIMREELKGR